MEKGRLWCLRRDWLAARTADHAIQVDGLSPSRGLKTRLLAGYGHSGAMRVTRPSGKIDVAKRVLCGTLYQGLAGDRLKRPSRCSGADRPPLCNESNHDEKEENVK